MSVKATKKELFIELRELVKDKVHLVEFVDHELELLEKKNSSKSKTQVAADAERVEMVHKVIDFMTVTKKAYTATEIAKELNVTNQKATAILGTAKDLGKVARNLVKNTAFYNAV